MGVRVSRMPTHTPLPSRITRRRRRGAPPPGPPPCPRALLRAWLATEPPDESQGGRCEAVALGAAAGGHGGGHEETSGHGDTIPCRSLFLASIPLSLSCYTISLSLSLCSSSIPPLLSTIRSLENNPCSFVLTVKLVPENPVPTAEEALNRSRSELSELSALSLAITSASFVRSASRLRAL